MRTRGPYEVKPRQLRALVVLLMLLPLIPTAFVVRFMVEAVSSERLEAREREHPIYQKFLETASSTFAAAAQRELTEPPTHPDDNDGAVAVAADGRLTPLPAVTPLARAVIDSGVRLAALPGRRAARWHFLCETTEPVFALSPPGLAVLRLKSREHLLAAVRAFYVRALDPQSVLVLLDENGESVPLSGGDNSDVAPAGTPLAEVALRAPLPLWRVQLFKPSASLIGAVSRDQFAFYFWIVGGVLAATAAIAGLAGLTLSLRIVLRELSNDALAVVSHEMKTPLASIRLFVETLLERRYAGGPEQADEYLRLIAQENRRLERLVDGFALLSRIERNRGRLVAPEIIDAAEVVGAARAQLQARLEGCDFAVEGVEGLPSFPGDADALTAVLVNLLDNALKYSGADRPWVRLRARADAANVYFEVSDHGRGVPPEEREKIFERFYQVDSRLSRVQQGLGLGLSIVRSIVHAHGGATTVVSSPGSGSTFTVRLPRNSLPSS